MVKSAQQEVQMRRYLLGELTEAEKGELDAAIFADNEAFDRMWEVENDLVDRYVRGRLSTPEREQFERHYLASPKHRDRIAVARTLLELADREADARSKSPAARKSKLADFFQPLQLVMAGALATALLLTGLWGGRLLMERNRLRDELAKMQANDAQQHQQGQNLENLLANERQRNEQLTSEIDNLRTEQNRAATKTGSTIPATQPAFVTFLLTSLQVRKPGDKLPELLIPPGADQVRLQMNFASDHYRSSQVAIRNVDTGNTWRRSGLTIKSEQPISSLVANVPSAKLPPGDYILTLTGLTASGETKLIDRYSFRVVKNPSPAR